MEKKTQTITEVSMKNGQIRKCLASIDLLIDLCIPKQTENSMWKESMAAYTAGMNLVKRKEDLTRDEVLDFQRNMDTFFQKWVTLFGDEGVTNYVHYLGSGHIAEYLLHWGNISSHSQQGWEAFNAAFKSFFYNRTQRGGAVSRGEGERTRLKPMARWLQRRLVFMQGHTAQSIQTGLDLFDDKEEEWLRTWVKSNGGTVEYGQFTNDESDDVDEETKKEVLFDWEFGPMSRKGEDTSESEEDDDDTDYEDDQSM